MEKDDELMDRVAEHRHKILMEEISRRSKRDKALQGGGGEVINFNAYTKTKGNA